MGIKKIVSSIKYQVLSINNCSEYIIHNILRSRILLRRTKYKIQNLGFTLVELMVVVAILATVGVVAANMFFQTLKGASKAELTKLVKQEGDYTISVMERMIRNAKNIEKANPSWECDNSNRPDIKIRNQDDNTTIFKCWTVGSDIYIASNSARLTSSRVQVSSFCNQFIRCTRTGSAPPVVEISFQLALTGSPTRPEEQAMMDFRTTVSLRTY